MADELISQLGFETSQRCGTSDCFWGDELTLQRKDLKWTVTAAFDPSTTLSIGIRRSEAAELETTDLVSETEQDEHWLVRKAYPYAGIANAVQALALVGQVRQELFETEFFDSRLTVRPAATVI
ncbi:hypothetical protein [Hymenobacter antarcticus]|uniref:Immunity protein 53 n=1 Tax=Hymenobacter antarcticus TaxID=486270 RepID=A0ABP7QM80_9BACT